METEKIPEAKVVDDSRSQTLHSSASEHDYEKTAATDTEQIDGPEETRYPGEKHANIVSDNELMRTRTSDSSIAYPTGAKLSLITLALCLSVFLMALDNTIIATAIPKITDEFKSLPDVSTRIHHQ